MMNSITISTSGPLKKIGDFLLFFLVESVVKPGFDLPATYLSDIGATPLWPQIFFNAGMLIVSPLRYIVLVLLVLRLYQSGAGRAFGTTALIPGVFTTLGTITMSVVPYPVDIKVHKLGMPQFFFGVVILQTLIGVREWQLSDVQRSLPTA